MEMSGVSRSGLTIKKTESTGAPDRGRHCPMPAAGAGGVAALNFRKLPWFRSGLQWRAHPFRQKWSCAPAPSADSWEGEIIRPARHVRCLSGYL